MQPTFDRAAEDLGNSIHLEHVNVRIPDQRLAMLFYAAGLGLTRDPVMMAGDGNMWINVGRSQFHLPTGNPQVVRGHTGLVIAGRAALINRLAAVRERLKGTRFGFSEQNDHVEAICPWGNRVRCYEPDPARFGPINLGIPYVEFDVPVGTAEAIVDFYRRMIDVPARVERNGANGAVARVLVGRDQHLLFRETDRALPEFDGHHVAIYIVNFSGPYRKLRERNLVSQEDNQYQYRFRDIVEPDGGRILFTVEHEVRSVTHPMYLRPLINRNPMLTNQNYAAGHEQMPWAIEPDQYDGRAAVRPS
jgi:predicted enzyme related to lactoylglutathione lyase